LTFLALGLAACYLANLFSEMQGSTIEHFIILHKVERIKELIFYGELNITEIAYNMNYSSVAHLSSQFKKVTGLSPSHFKQMKDKRRMPIEEVGMVREDSNHGSSNQGDSKHGVI
jgi:AraC-like DNA-binding protein